jgi:hypothetical protein
MASISVRTSAELPRQTSIIERQNACLHFALTAIAVVAFSAVGQARVVERIPVFDIARSYSAEVASVGAVFANCTEDETDAKNELTKRWSQFGASEKDACVGESSIGRGQSHVELLTCLEMPNGEFSSTVSDKKR